MSCRSKRRVSSRSVRLKHLKTELEGVEQFLYQLRHNRGRWPKVWVTGMIRYYDDRRMKLRDQISRLRRK